MKTEQTKEYLIRAMQTMPNDFALAEVRNMLSNTIQKLEEIESKRFNRKLEKPKTIYDTWHEALRKNTTLSMTPKGLQIIDTLITQEQKNLEQLEQPEQEPEQTITESS